MATNKKIQIIIDLIDNASRQFKKIGANTERLATDFKEVGMVAGGAFAALSGLAIRTTRDFADMERAMRGLDSVARAYGHNVDDVRAAMERLSEDGLLSPTQAAEALKNTLAGLNHLTLEQAELIVAASKDTAAYNRVIDDYGQSVVTTTKGLRNRNSVLTDTAGIQKNLLTIMREHGMSLEDLDSATEGAKAQQVLFNEWMEESAFAMGDAARMSQGLTGQQARLQASTKKLSAIIGKSLSPVTKELYAALGNTTVAMYEFVKANPAIVAGIFAATMAITGLTAAVIGLAVAWKGFLKNVILSSISFMTTPLGLVLTALGALLGVLTYRFVKTKMAARDSFEEVATSAQQNFGAVSDAAKGMSDDVTREIAEINRQIEKENRSYQENLAEIVRKHQDTVEDLQDSIEKEKMAFEQAQEEKAKSFERSEEDRRTQHKRTVEDIKRDIQEEVDKGKEADEERIKDLKRRLEREEEDYKKYMERLEEDREKEMEQLKEDHEEKKEELEDRLEREKELLEKHKDDVLAVKDIQLRDEIQKLKDSHEERLKELEKQKKDTIRNAKETTEGINEQLGMIGEDLDFGEMGEEFGSDMMTGFVGAFLDPVKEIFTKEYWRDMVDFLSMKSPAFRDLVKIVRTAPDKKELGALLGEVLIPEEWRSATGQQFGGYVRAGQPHIVGERGPEMFVPDQAGRVEPKVSGGVAPVFNAHVHIGMYAGSALEKRKVAEALMSEFKYLARSKGRTVWEEIQEGGNI